MFAVIGAFGLAFSIVIFVYQTILRGKNTSNTIYIEVIVKQSVTCNVIQLRKTSYLQHSLPHVLLTKLSVYGKKVDIIGKTNRLRDKSAIIPEKGKGLNDTLVHRWHRVVDRLLHLFDLCYGSLNVDCSFLFTLFCLSSGWRGNEDRYIEPLRETEARRQTFNSYLSLVRSQCLFPSFILYSPSEKEKERKRQLSVRNLEREFSRL